MAAREEDRAGGGEGRGRGEGEQRGAETTVDIPDVLMTRTESQRQTAG